MRALKNGTKIIGVDHGYGNIKTANTIMPTGITAYQTAPTFDGNTHASTISGLWYSLAPVAVIVQTVILLWQHFH